MSEWISCSERLPDGAQRVLVNTKYCGRLVCGLSGNYDDNDNFIPRRWGCINEIDFELNEVTHWMPLPPPPKGENK